MPFMYLIELRNILFIKDSLVIKKEYIPGLSENSGIKSIQEKSFEEGSH